MATPLEPIASDSKTDWSTQQVYVLAVVSLLVGLSVGYLFLGKPANPGTARTPPPISAANLTPTPKGGHPQITLEQMKQLANVKASTLIEKSKADPKNSDLLAQIAAIYQSSHQFKEAADYFKKALEIDPKNVANRTSLASCLYYSGDVDGAIDQLKQALKYNPKDANALFNLGMIKYQGKKDPAGAIATWEQLLKQNLNLDRKPIVEQMIAEAKARSETKN
jgi:cytochrome c-type biogenesis protein CcmH/NrfG